MKTVNAILSAALLVCLALSLLASCAQEQRVWVRYKDVAITEQTYRFWLATTKKQYATGGDGADTEEFWNKRWQSAEGKSVTTAEFVEQMVQKYAANVAVELQMFSDRGLKLTDAQEKQVDDYIDQLVFYRYGDSKSALNEDLKRVYGVTVEDLRKTLIIEAKVKTLEEALFGENGSMRPTAEEKDEYYKEHYVRLQIIAVNLKKDYVRNDKGEIERDSLGNYKTRDLTTEEQENKKSEVEAILALAREGGDFTAMVGTYGEQIGASHPQGLYFSDEDRASIIKNGFDGEILDAMFAQQIGTVKRYDAADDAVYIVRRAELEEGAYDLPEESDQFSTFLDRVTTQKMARVLEQLTPEVRFDPAVEALRVVDIEKGVL